MVKRHTDTDILDKNIGQKIQELRLAQGFSRKKLGDMIGVTHQQCQKYETGANRISAARLVLVAHVLGRPVDYFYQGVFNATESTPQEKSDQRLCMEVAKNLMKIKAPEYKSAISSLVKTIAKISS